MPARCWARSPCSCSSSCSSRSARAGCSRSRAGRWRHDHAPVPRGPRRARLDLPGHPGGRRHRRAVPQRVRAAHLAVPRLDHDGGAVGQVPVLRAARALARSGVGLLRHPLARPRRLLRARRLRHGHVPDAPDRHARRLRPSDPSRLHDVPELEGAALVLVRLQPLPLRGADDRGWCPACSPSCSAGSPSAAASPASICRSSPRRSPSR